MRSVRSIANERGHVLLMIMLALGVAAVPFVQSSVAELARAVKADMSTYSALAEAKQALIGRAAADADRPGSLPCPDTTGDGLAEPLAGTQCPAYIGRLPWRTLGLPDLRDQTGQPLWYALSPNFRDHGGAGPLNSDTKGTLRVLSGSTAATMTDEALALVFAPGAPVARQVRDGAESLCTTTGSNLRRDLCAANYLDGVGSASNASPTGPFIAAIESESFNDKVAAIVAADLMPLVEQRVARELRKALLAYREASACQCYPWADAEAAADGVSDSGVNRGRVPWQTALPHNWSPGMLPAYFVANEWSRVIYYSVSRAASEGQGSTCSTCSESTLSIDTTSGYDLVLITTGYAASNRPSTNLADYVDDQQNRDANDRFVTPLSPRADRDRIFPVIADAATCAPQAQALISNAPCGGPGNSLIPACRSAAATLAACTCSAAAAAMISPPCTNTLNAPQCNAALNQLQACVR